MCTCRYISNNIHCTIFCLSSRIYVTVISTIHLFGSYQAFLAVQVAVPFVLHGRRFCFEVFVAPLAGGLIEFINATPNLPANIIPTNIA